MLHGDQEDALVPIPFWTSLPCNKDNSDDSSFDQTQITTGVTNDEDVDGLTGVHSCVIDTTDAWYETGHDYTVVLSASTINIQVVNMVIAQFSIENRYINTPELTNVIQSVVQKHDQNMKAIAFSEN